MRCARASSRPSNVNCSIATGSRLRARIAGTRVADAGGNPVRVYHGSPRSFEEMDPDKAGEGSTLGKGFSFSKDPKDANLFAANPSGEPGSSIARTESSARGGWCLEGLHANLAPEPLCGSEQFVKEMRPSWRTSLGRRIKGFVEGTADYSLVVGARVLKRYNAIELATDRLGWINSTVFRGMKAMPSAWRVDWAGVGGHDEGCSTDLLEDGR
jgi:hypothetical protein